MLRGFVRSYPKFQTGFHTVCCKIHTRAAATVEELENVYAERKCSINGKFTWGMISCILCFIVAEQ